MPIKFFSFQTRSVVYPTSVTVSDGGSFVRVRRLQRHVDLLPSANVSALGKLMHCSNNMETASLTAIMQ